MLRSQLLSENGGITESQRRGWGLEQGGLRNLAENGMRVLRRSRCQPISPVSFSCPLDPLAVPGPDEQGLFSALDRGVNRAQSKS